MATGVNADCRREILCLDLMTSEDGAGWTAFLRDLVARGFSGLQVVVPDDHRVLPEAIAAVTSHQVDMVATLMPAVLDGWRCKRICSALRYPADLEGGV